MRATHLITVAGLLLAAALAGPLATARADSAITKTQPAVTVLPAPNPVSPEIFKPPSQTIPPPTFAISARQAIAVADRTEQVRHARERHPRLKGTAYISPLQLAAGRFYHWDVMYTDGDDRIVEVELGRTGRVFEVQTAPDVGWELVRGYPGVLGGKLNAPYVWLPLCLLFLLPFIDPRRPFRLLHLDLLVLLGFGASHFFFAAGRPDISVPLVYPFLFYVFVRALMAAFRPRRRAGPLVPLAPTSWLAIAVALLLLGRLVFAIFGADTTDVSTAGVIGADRIMHGLDLYVYNDIYGDTYGPLAYLVYIPAELVFPYTLAGGALGAATAAAVLFDALMTLGLFLLGRGLRSGPSGTRLGVILAFAWVAYPYSALVIASTTNDVLVPLFVVYALVLIASPAGRGLVAGLAAVGKFAPVIVAPVLVTGRGPFRLKPVAIASACAVAAPLLLIAAFLPDGGVSEFWKATLGFQFSRESPLALWGRYPELAWLRVPLELGLVALAAAAAFVPRRRRTGQVAAVCAALLVGVQIPANYWIYFYIVWFAPFLLVALFEEHADLGPEPDVAHVSVTRSFGKRVRRSQPSSVTATRSSMRTPSLPGR